MHLRLILPLLFAGGLLASAPAAASEVCIIISVPVKYDKNDIATKIRRWRSGVEDATRVPVFVFYNGAPFMADDGVKRNCDRARSIAAVEVSDPKKDAKGVMAISQYSYGPELSLRGQGLLPGPSYTLKFRINEGVSGCPATPEYVAFLNAVALYYRLSSDEKAYKKAIQQLSKYEAMGACNESQASLAYYHAEKLWNMRWRKGH
jgi:hypothetical protein